MEITSAVNQNETHNVEHGSSDGDVAIKSDEADKEHLADIWVLL